MIRLLIILSNIRIIMVVRRLRRLRRRFRNMWLCMLGVRRIIRWFWIRFRGGCRLLGICRNDFMRGFWDFVIIIWFILSLSGYFVDINLLYLYLYCIYINSSIYGKHPNYHYRLSCCNPHHSLIILNTRYHNSQPSKSLPITQNSLRKSS